MSNFFGQVREFFWDWFVRIGNVVANGWNWLMDASNFWSAFLATVFGALIVFWLEHMRNKRERVERELGQCHTLVFLLTQMLTALEDFNDQLFVRRAKRLGRPARWDEIGGLEGVSEQGPVFSIGDFMFLINGSDRKSNAPLVLSRIYRATINFDAILARLNRRTHLWHDYLRFRATPPGRGEAAFENLGKSTALTAQIRELTEWLQEDIPEEISNIRGLLPQLYDAMRIRFSSNEFIVPLPVMPPTSPDAPHRASPDRQDRA